MSRYPEITAGTRLRASILQAMIPQIILKAAHTDRASTTTVTDDPELQITLAEGVYFVEIFLLLGGNLNGDIKTAWGTTGTMSGLKSVIGPSSNANNSGADQITMRAGVHGLGTEIIYSGVRDATANLFRVYEHSVVTVAAAGVLSLQWAQVSSVVTASRVAAGSLMRVTQIA